MPITRCSPIRQVPRGYSTAAQSPIARSSVQPLNTAFSKFLDSIQHPHYFRLHKMTSTLDELYIRLASHRGLLSRLDFKSLYQFVVHAALMKDDIILVQPSTYITLEIPPSFLPPTILEFFSRFLHLNIGDVEACWAEMKDIIWDSQLVSELQASPQLAFIKFNGHEDRKSTRLNSSHSGESRMPSSA